MQIQHKGVTFRIPLSSTIALFFALTGSLVYFYVSTASERNHQRFDLEVDGLSRVITGEGDLALVRIKDMIAMIASGYEAKLEEKLSSAVKRSNYVLEVGHFSADADFKQRHYLLHGDKVTLDRVEVEALGAMLKQHPGQTRVVLPRNYPRSFGKLSDTDVIYVQSVLDPERREKDLIVYLILDLKSALTDAIGLYASSTRVKDVQVEVKGDTFNVNIESSAPETMPFAGVRVTKRRVILARDAQIAIDFVEHFPGMRRLILFVLGLIVIFAVASTLFALFARSARIANARLEDAVKRANTANEAKSEFLANMSHEIRTPLNGVLGLAEVLSRTDLSKVQRNYTQQILASGSLLLTILNDILDMAKLESGQLSINPTKIQLPFQLKETVSFYFAQALEQGLELVLDVAPDVPHYVRTDPMRLRQILGNLIGNAIKFTPKGTVTVAASFEQVGPTAGSILITITDTGVGLTEEQQEKLFGRFVQARDDTAGLYGGTGLGLAICKKLCVAMGGDIAVTSSLGDGSTFAFWLPVAIETSLSKAATEVRRIVVVTGSQAQFRAIARCLTDVGYDSMQLDYGPDLASQLRRALKDGPISVLIFDEERDIHRACEYRKIVNENIAPATPALILGETEINGRYQEFDAVLSKPFVGSDLVDKLRMVSAASARSSSSVDLRSEHANPTDLRQFSGYRALLVDDNQINLMVLEEIMHGFGFTTESTTDGARSVTMAEAGAFDLVLMDCQMPGMNGFAAAAKLRALMACGRLQKLAIVAATANALNGDREACVEAGMDDVLFKPISIQSLADLLDRLVEIGLLQAPPAQVALVPAALYVTPAMIGRSAVGTAVTSLTATMDGAHGQKTAAEARSAMSALRAEVSREDAIVDVVSATRADLPHPHRPPAKVPLMDLAILKQTRDLVRNFETLLSLYRSDTRTYLNAIREQFANDQLNEAVLPAHTIRSSSAVIGALGIASLAGLMETRLRTGEGCTPAELQRLLQRMEEVFDHTLRQLDILEADGLLKSPLTQAS